MDAFSASLMADKREIIFAPTVYKFQTFAQMAEEFKLNERDVVLTTTIWRSKRHSTEPALRIPCLLSFKRTSRICRLLFPFWIRRWRKPTRL